MAAPYLLDLQRRVITLAGIPGDLDDLGDVTVPAPNDCDVLTYDAGTSEWINAPIGEGPGIDIVCLQVGLGGDTVLLYDSTGNPVAEYDADSAGFDAALTAATSGDAIVLPACTISGNHTISDGIVVIGMGWDQSILSGTITNNGTIHNLRVSGSLNIGATGRTEYAEIVTVAKEGGDFTTIQGAIDSISDASSTKRYLVRVMPGTYTEQVTMKSWIDIRGAGKHATRINYGANTGTIILNDNVQIEDLLIEITTTSTNWAIVGDNKSAVHIRNIDILAPLNDNSYKSQGIKLTGATWRTCFIEHCVINTYTDDGWGIYLTGNSHWIDTSINNVFIDTYGIDAGNPGGCIYINNAQDIQIKGSCHFRTDYGDPISINGSSEVEIFNTVLESDANYPSLNVGSGATVRLEHVSGRAYSSSGTIYGWYSNLDSDTIPLLDVFGGGGAVRFVGTPGGGIEHIAYNDSGGTLRGALIFPGSNIVVLGNRASDGVVQIRANTSTAGSGGEQTAAQFEDDKIIFYKIIQLAEQAATPPTPPSGYAYLYPKTDGDLYFLNDSGTEYNLIDKALNELTDVDTTGVGTGDIIYKSAGDWIDYPLGIADTLGHEDGGYEIGGAADYIRVDDITGNTRLYGEAIAWKDELQSLIVQGLNNPSSDITINYTEGCVEFDDDSGLSDYAIMNIQMNHDWALGTDIHPHLHWWQASADVPNWLIQYRWQINGAAKTTAWTYQPYTTHSFIYSAGTLNQITEFGTITPPAGAGLSDIVQFRLIRDTNNDSTEFGDVDPLAGDAQAVNFDIHYQVDSFGSDEEYIKDTSELLTDDDGEYLLDDDGQYLEDS